MKSVSAIIYCLLFLSPALASSDQGNPEDKDIPTVHQRRSLSSASQKIRSFFRRKPATSTKTNYVVIGASAYTVGHNLGGKKNSQNQLSGPDVYSGTLAQQLGQLETGPKPPVGVPKPPVGVPKPPVRVPQNSTVGVPSNQSLYEPTDPPPPSI